MTKIKTDKIVVENGADFTFVCRKIPFAISCSELHHGNINLIDLDLVIKMKIPLRNIKVKRMSLLGHDVRAVGRIKQTIQCVVNGQVQGSVHLEGKVVRDLYSLFNVDCFASFKTYERLMGREPPDPSDEGYNSTEDVPNLGGEDEDEIDKDDNGKDEESSTTKDSPKEEEEDPPDPPDVGNPPENRPLPNLNMIHDPTLPNCAVFEYPDKEDDLDNAKLQKMSDDLYADYYKFGPGPRDLQEMKLNNMQDEEDEDELHCELCFREGKAIKVVRSHGDRCPTCPSLTPKQKERILGPNWKLQAEMIFKARYYNNKEKGRE